MTLDFHAVNCRLITDVDDDMDAVLASFRRFLVDVDIEKEKIVVSRDAFIDSTEAKRYVCMMQIKTARVVRTFVKQLFVALSVEQKKVIKSQLETRIDEECQFFLRFEKNSFVKDGKIVLTDGGHCFHITLTVASFPHKKSVAVSVVEKYLN